MLAQPFAGPIFWPDILTALAGRQAYPKRWTTLLRQRMWGGQMVQGASNIDTESVFLAKQGEWLQYATIMEPRVLSVSGDDVFTTTSFYFQIPFFSAIA